MAAVESTMLPLRTKAPDFSLPDPRAGVERSLQDVKGERATVVMFICNHCPFVKHLIDDLVDFARSYMPKGVGVVGISSNDARNYPEDAPERMKEYAETGNYPFPYLYDESQDVARAYHAACTPDFYIFDADLSLVYRGQFDDSRPGNGMPITGKDMRDALDSILAGQPVSFDQKPSIGCNIKWK